MQTQLEMFCKIIEINLIGVLKIQFRTEATILLQEILLSGFRNLLFLFSVFQLFDIKGFKLVCLIVLKLVNMDTKKEYGFLYPCKLRPHRGPN